MRHTTVFYHGSYVITLHRFLDRRVSCLVLLKVKR